MSRHSPASLTMASPVTSLRAHHSLNPAAPILPPWAFFPRSRRLFWVARPRFARSPHGPRCRFSRTSPSLGTRRCVSHVPPTGLDVVSRARLPPWVLEAAPRTFPSRASMSFPAHVSLPGYSRLRLARSPHGPRCRFPLTSPSLGTRGCASHVPGPAPRMGIPSQPRATPSVRLQQSRSPEGRSNSRTRCAQTTHRATRLSHCPLWRL